MAAYLPVYCSSCAQASLSLFNEPEAEHVRCSFCESTARVVPGPLYGDGDWLAFAEIDKAVAEAELSGVEASQLVGQLQDLLDLQTAPQAIVQRMLELLPALVGVRPALVNRLPRGIRMLMTLLSARTREATAELGDAAPAPRVVAPGSVPARGLADKS
jgi:hypothetical protein